MGDEINCPAPQICGCPAVCRGPAVWLADDPAASHLTQDTNQGSPVSLHKYVIRDGTCLKGGKQNQSPSRVEGSGNLGETEI